MNFLSVFNPSNQLAYTKDIARCYTGGAPALGTVRKAFGDAVAITWIAAQLKDLSEFSGCRDKLTDSQMDSIAQVVLSEFGYMSVTQMMHFFLQFKAGRYGRFYGAVDGLVITEALQKFRDERYDTIVRLEKEQKEREKEAEDRRHQALVDDGNRFRAERHISIEDFQRMFELGITEREEIDAVYWLLKM